MIKKKLFFISCLLLRLPTVYPADQSQRVPRVNQPSRNLIGDIRHADRVILNVTTGKLENDAAQSPNFFLGAFVGALQHGLATVIAEPLHSILTDFNRNLFATEAELKEDKKKKDADEQANVIFNEHNSLATQMELLAGKQKIIEKYKSLPNHDQTVLAKWEAEFKEITKKLEFLLSNDLDKFHAYVKSLRSAQETTQKK